jgi:nucleotidyltransferase/DNA polymerase involved in DNA repair
MSPTQQAIIQITTSGKNFSQINYSRRMYAIIRRYTPDVSEGEVNECFADLTGLRTFFNMTYKQIAERIKADLTREIGIAFTIRVAPVKMLLKNKSKTKKESISTYKEINSLFAGSSLFKSRSRANMRATKRRFTIPFIGKVN